MSDIPKKYKLSDADVRMILIMRQYKFQKQEICDKFNVPTWVVDNVLRRKVIK